jgi:hypothetical protein
MKSKCDKARFGWWCSRKPGHAGPCAAKPRWWNIRWRLWLVLFLAVHLCGCAHTDIIVPFDAPVMLSQDETIHNPYVRQHGGWVMKSGTITRHQGAVILLLPATSQPTT